MWIAEDEDYIKESISLPRIVRKRTDEMVANSASARVCYDQSAEDSSNSAIRPTAPFSTAARRLGTIPDALDISAINYAHSAIQK